VWASTQAPFSVKPAVAQALGIQPYNVHVITPYVGGGFGGKSGAPQAVEAARLAKIAGKPVQVGGTGRGVFYDPFRPAPSSRSAPASPRRQDCILGRKVYAAGEREATPFYDIPTTTPNRLAAGWRQPSRHAPVRHRSLAPPSANTNTFAANRTSTLWPPKPA